MGVAWQDSVTIWFSNRQTQLICGRFPCNIWHPGDNLFTQHKSCCVLPGALPILSPVCTDCVCSRCKFTFRCRLAFLQHLCVCPPPPPVPPTPPFFSPALTVQADSLLLLCPVCSCSPILPLLPEGLFMLGMAAHTSLTPRLRATISQTQPAPSGPAGQAESLHDRTIKGLRC